MKFLILLLAIAYCEARPSALLDGSRATLYGNVDSYIIGGSNAPQGAYPWQLSQQRGSGTSFSHSCGASLLSSRYGLSAAHCVDGSAASALRVVAGLHDRTNTAGTQTTDISTYKMHEQYDNGQASYANDIAILTFTTAITPGGNIQFATIPTNNNNNYAGQTCVISGWGRTSSSSTLPNVLQHANIGILANAECLNMAGSGIWANHICVYDSSQQRGACNGDSGGPINCPSGSSHVVTGIASFVYQNAGNCLPSYPSVYTRVSTYISWISTNTP